MTKPASSGTWSVTLLIGALDALAAAGGLLALLVLATTLSWWIDSGATGTWLGSFQTAIEIWLGAHGVPLGISASTQFGLSIPSYLLWSLPLGSVLLIFAFGWRGGKRLFPAVSVWPAWLAAAIVYGGISSSISTLVTDASVHPNPIASYILPALVYVGGVICGSLFGSLPKTFTPLEISRERVAGKEFIQSLSGKVNWVIASVASPALRAATGYVFALLTISSLLLSLLVIFNWLSVIQLFEQLQGGVFGGFGATILQIAFLPNLIFFVASWLSGFGFAIGTGSSVSPLGTALGPIPTIPIFGVIPTGSSNLGMIVLILPILLALVATVIVRP